ncbi:MAG TPA: type II toxin-antitoxin system RelE/ParE family toxin [bacterium]|nr:type II toxin-antitoxin system RelE/ParE family toxin [bacterium]HPN45203.1 type II toxin-antitoxin system RelE/ParE family toxin [bacterium]
MVNYKIEIKKSAAKELDQLPVKDLHKIIEKIQGLSVNPRPPGCVKLTDQEKYRIRVGRYRILYSIEDKMLVVYIVKIAHRKDAYK